MTTPRSIVLSLVACGAGFATTTEAALVSSTLDTFSNPGTGGAVPGSYTPFGAVSSLTLESLAGGGKADSAIFDGSDDGYLRVARPGTDGAIVGFIRALGTIDAADVGKVVTIDVAYLRASTQGQTTTHRIELDGVSVGGTGEGAINTFGAGNDPNASTGLLSSVLEAPLSYTVLPGDVGSELTYTASYFASNETRDLGIDAVSITVAAIPEPSQVMAFGTVTWGFAVRGGWRRRRR